MQANRMNDNIEKENLLRSEGFRYYFRPMMYVSRERRSVFTIEALEANSLDWIRARATRKHKRWCIYTKGNPLPRGVRREVLKEIGAAS